ncbi:hypothetical protein HMI54_010408, partial [Coelomomyces lativittatus]
MVRRSFKDQFWHACSNGDDNTAAKLWNERKVTDADECTGIHRYDDGDSEEVTALWIAINNAHSNLASWLIDN